MKLGIDRAHLVVHDFGAPWGFTWAASQPDAFASVPTGDRRWVERGARREPRRRRRVPT
jgi:hypothetical protein